MSRIHTNQSIGFLSTILKSRHFFILHLRHLMIVKKLLKVFIFLGDSAYFVIQKSIIAPFIPVDIKKTVSFFHFRFDNTAKRSQKCII